MHDLHVAGSRYEVSVVSQAARDVLTVPGKGARPCAPTTAGTGCCRHPRDDNRHRLKPDDVRSGCSSTHGGDERPFGKHLVLPYPARHPRPPPYALPTPGVNHVHISGSDRHRCCCGRLSQWQCAAPVVPARAGWIAVPARHARGARCGVRQPCCRASHAHDPARGGAVPRMVRARTTSRISFPSRTPTGILLPARIARVWSAAAMLPRQPCSRPGAWWSGAPDGQSTNNEPYLVPILHTDRDTASSPDCPRMECGSHTAAPAVHTTRRVVERCPEWSEHEQRAVSRSHPAHRQGYCFQPGLPAYGVRQPCCRASRTHDPARGGAVPRMVRARTTSRISFPSCTPTGILLPARIARVWRAAAMLPRQPYTRPGAWYAVPHPGHLCITQTWGQPRSYQRV
ncbi:MAG: hypothetical protein KatS3mg056_0573 [Chloroflexus sp.]|nr:MAG: hypothetical protein KatS3mg056_0573 [Chloroflexus sp.]